MMKKMKITKRRGSTLVLALVLTMVLFIMGIAFISTTSIQREMVVNVGQEQFVNDGVDEVVAKIKLELKKDLFESEIDDDPFNDGDYSGFLQGVASYDYPDEKNRWLASLLPESGTADTTNTPDYVSDDVDVYYFPHISDLWGKFKDFPNYDTGSSSYWLDSYYDPDPDPVFRTNTIYSNSMNNLAWLYMVDGNSHTLCRTVDRDEKIEWPLLNSYTLQWDSASYNSTSDFSDFLGNATEYVLDDYRIFFNYSQNQWQNIDTGYPFTAPNWYFFNTERPTPAATPHGMRADADGDGVTDSRWVRLGRVSSDADYIYAAVRIIDNGGMVNLNTAFRRPGWLDNGTYYSPYDYSMVGSTINVNNPAMVLDDWDGSSVSQIDSLGLARPVDFNLNTFTNSVGTYFCGYSMYYGMGNENITALHDCDNGVMADLLFAINKSACPYNPNYYSIDTGAGSITGYFAEGVSLKFKPLELSDELFLRSNFFLQNINQNSQLAQYWQDTINPGAVGYNRSRVYIADESTNGATGAGPNSIADYYEQYWNWYRKCGLDLTGNPYLDIRNQLTAASEDRLARRLMVTTYNKDRIVRPEFDTSSFPASCGFSASDVLKGMRRCYVGPIIAGQDSNGDGVNDEFTDVNLDGIADDWDLDTTANDMDDARREPITLENLASAIYMGLPGDADIADRFSRSDDRYAQKTYPLAEDNAIDYDRVLLSWQMALNLRDYQDVEGTFPSAVAGAVSYQNINGYNSFNHTIFGHENLEQVKKDTICISKISSLYSFQSGTDDGLPNGSYYAIELFNPDDLNDKTDTDLENYDLVFVDKDNEIICKVNLEGLNDPNNDRVEGTLKKLDAFTGNTSDSTFTLCFYSGVYSGQSKDVDPNDTASNYNSFLDEVLMPSKHPLAQANLFDPLLHDNNIKSEFGISDTARTMFIGDKIVGKEGYLDTLEYAGKSGSTELTAYALFNLAEKLYVVKRDIDGNAATDENLPVDMVDFRAIEQSYDSRNGTSLSNTTDFFDQTIPNLHRLVYRAETWWGDTNYILMPSFSINGYDSDVNDIDPTKSYNPWFYKEDDISLTHILSTFVWAVGDKFDTPSVLSEDFDPNDTTKYPDAVSTAQLIVEPIIGNSADTTLNNIKEFASYDISGLEKVTLDSLIDIYPNDYNAYNIRNLSQIQDMLAVGPRVVFDTSVSVGKAFYATPLIYALLRAENASEDEIGLAGKIDLSDPDYYGLTEFLTVIDPTHDGIDNDGDGRIDIVDARQDGIDNDDDGQIDELDESYNSDGIDNDGDGFIGTATGYIDEDEYMADQIRLYENTIAGRININTAPWYVIARLPWVTEELAQAIVAYRDKKRLDIMADDSISIFGSVGSRNGEKWPYIVNYKNGPLDFRDATGTVFPTAARDMEDPDMYPIDFKSAEFMKAWQDWTGWKAGEGHLDWDFDNDGNLDGPKNLHASRQWGMGKFMAGGADDNFNESPGFRNIAELLNVTHDVDDKSGLSDDMSYLKKHGADAAESRSGVYDYSNASAARGRIINPSNIFGLVQSSHYDYRYDIGSWGKTYYSSTTEDVDNDNNENLVAQSPNSTSGNISDIYTMTPFYRQDDLANDGYGRNLIFSRISNLVTTRSDVFTAYILVRVGEDGPQRRMIGIFDRSGVYSGDDEVRLVALYQVPEAE